jgi:predicted heme/steroid binding protein
MFSEEELKLFTGEHNSPLYLALLGEVYDVSAAKDKYGESTTIVLHDVCCMMMM